MTYLNVDYSKSLFPVPELRQSLKKSSFVLQNKLRNVECGFKLEIVVTTLKLKDDGSSSDS